MAEMSWSERTAQSIMERLPRLYEDRGYNGKWSYDYGVVLKGFENLGNEQARRNICIL